MTSTLAKRDGGLSTGAIAGIIVAIVVVAFILLGLFIWRLLSYRDNFGPYSARSRYGSAREKARAQARGHIRSTRPRDEEDIICLNEEKDRSENGRSSNAAERGQLPIAEDQHSTNGTVHDEEESRLADTHLSKGKQAERNAEQDRDYEIFQGHHSGPAPAFDPSQSQHGYTQGGVQHTTETYEKKGGIRQGCTTM